LNSKALDEYAGVLTRMMRDTIQLQLGQSLIHQQSRASLPQPHSSIAQLQTASTVTHRLSTPAAAATSSSAATQSIPQSSVTVDASSPVSSGILLRPAVLFKLQSRIPALLKSLHALAIHLHKSKRVRTLLSDLVEEVLRPLLKLGASSSEVLCHLRQVRDAVASVPSWIPFGIEREPVYPHAYERRQAELATATAASAPRQTSLPAPQSTPSTTRSLASSMLARAGSATPLGMAANFSSASESLRRSLVHWCRWLDAVIPICVILFIKLVQAQDMP
jgi:hypothetical protein